jgi:hypothetical protein
MRRVRENALGGELTVAVSHAGRMRGAQVFRDISNSDYRDFSLPPERT